MAKPMPSVGWLSKDERPGAPLLFTFGKYPGGSQGGSAPLCREEGHKPADEGKGLRSAS
jgi:hypothetical protein